MSSHRPIKRRSGKLSKRQREEIARRTQQILTGNPEIPSESLFLLQPKAQQPKARRAANQPKLSIPDKDRVDLLTPASGFFAQPRHGPNARHNTSALDAFLALPDDTTSPPIDLDEVTRAMVFDDDGVTQAMHDEELRKVMSKTEDSAERQRRRREALFDTWSSATIPRLIRPLLRLRHRQPPWLHDVRSCMCPRPTSLKVLLAAWDDLRYVQLRVCQCRPAADQLLAVGYFPCAPLRPTVAFSTRLLTFISIHSLRVPPNATAFAESLQDFWRQLHKAVGHIDIRKRLSTALTWWQILENRADALVSSVIERPLGSKYRALTEDCEVANAPAAEVGSSHTPPAVSHQAWTAEKGLLRPSDHLRAACPLCFGGSRPVLEHGGPDIIVCLDANFQQKRRKSKFTDPKVSFTGGAFVSAERVSKMENIVQTRRQGRVGRRNPARASKVSQLGDDVLDECESSFVAAQEKVAKASKNYYADTGLMACLCRHDRVLFLVNMTSVGEKQYNAMALLDTLKDELPDDWTVGVLYDIACQLSRSVEKYGFLDTFSDRISWAVSVFHAYGHQWACQVLFHPRKCEGFGRSDGEGCERFWSCIRKMVPVLRVTGYHRRMFLLDRQVKHIHEDGLPRLCVWLSRRHADSQTALLEAEKRLAVLGLSEAELQLLWKAQVNAQTRKPERKKQNAADMKIDQILVELSDWSERKAEVVQRKAALKRKMNSLSSAQTDAETDKISTEDRELKSWRKHIGDKMAALGELNQRKLRDLKGNPYLRARINARALRSNIRSSVVAHKFERARLERHFRAQIQQNRDHEQAKEAVHRREKGLNRMIASYNALVSQMEELAKAGKAPTRRVITPRRIDPRQLFRLDVDDEIWQEDPGLGPQDEESRPRWETDPAVREGIQLMLQLKRAREEMERITHEVRALLEWVDEEISVLASAAETCSGDDPVLAEIQWRREACRQLRNRWLLDLRAIGDPVIDGRITGSLEMAASSGEQVLSPVKPFQHPAIVTGASNDPLLLDYSTEDDTEDDRSSILSSDADFEDGFDSAVEDAGDDWMDDEGIKDVPNTRVPAEGQADDQNPVIEISEDEDHLLTHPHSVKKHREVEDGRVCGRYKCLGEDVSRIGSRTRWMTGQGLAVFVEAEYQRLQPSDIIHLDSTVFWMVRQYEASRSANEEEHAAQHYTRLRKMVTDAIGVSSPNVWLAVVHIELPQHWTLVQITWSARKVEFFDSFSHRSGYADEVQELTWTLLKLCSDIMHQKFDLDGWTWHGEARKTRQSNSYDCGGFVAADVIGLMESGQVSQLRECDMGTWRMQMVQVLRALPTAMAGKGTVKNAGIDA